MTQDHPSKLSFSIEESVWLNKGQEIQEILSMSLEPEITIEEKEEHVYIRGGLQLIGEYRPAPKKAELNLEEGSIQDQVAYRSIEEVSLSDNGIGEIRHIFPIDVTIPLNRINNLDDVYVQVDSFDYDLPEKGCIQLTADIMISGMSGSERAPQQEVEEATFIPELIEESEPIFTREDRSFSFEARKAPDVEVAQQEETTVEETTEVPVAAFEQEVPLQPELRSIEPDEDKADVVENAPKVSFQSNKSPAEVAQPTKESFTSYFVQDHRPPVVATPPEQEMVVDEPTDLAVNREEEQQSGIHLDPIKNLVNAQTTNEVERDDVELEEQQEEAERPNYSKKQENALYLTKMLTNGEEQFSKLKMCIIQGNESLDTIAERYEVSTSQLLRVNRLNQERVEEGQILYIPVSSK